MSKYDVQRMKVVLGDHNLKVSGETAVPSEAYAVDKVIRHKSYDQNLLVNAVTVILALFNLYTY
jgi:hypothetical protein